MGCRTGLIQRQESVAVFKCPGDHIFDIVYRKFLGIVAEDNGVIVVRYIIDDIVYDLLTCTVVTSVAAGNIPVKIVISLFLSFFGEFLHDSLGIHGAQSV